MCKKVALRSQTLAVLNGKLAQIQTTVKPNTVVQSTLEPLKKYDLDAILSDIQARTLIPQNKLYQTDVFETFAIYFWGFEFSKNEVKAYSSQVNLNLDLVVLHSKQKIAPPPLIIENEKQEVAILDGSHRILGVIVSGAKDFHGDMLTAKQLTPYEV